MSDEITVGHYASHAADQLRKACVTPWNEPNMTRQIIQNSISDLEAKAETISEVIFERDKVIAELREELKSAQSAKCPQPINRSRGVDSPASCNGTETADRK